MSPAPRNLGSFGPRIAGEELDPTAAELLRQALEALRSAVHRAADTDLELLIRGTLAPINSEDHADSAGAAAFFQPLAEATLQFQSDYIRRVISQCDGNMTTAAERLGLHRANLYRKMRQLGMVEGRSGVEDR